MGARTGDKWRHRPPITSLLQNGGERGKWRQLFAKCLFRRRSRHSADPSILLASLPPSLSLSLSLSLPFLVSRFWFPSLGRQHPSTGLSPLGEGQGAQPPAPRREARKSKDCSNYARYGIAEPDGGGAGEGLAYTVEDISGISERERERERGGEEGEQPVSRSIRQEFILAFMRDRASPSSPPPPPLSLSLLSSSVLCCSSGCKWIRAGFIGPGSLSLWARSRP